MYMSIYVYFVQRENIEPFLKVQRETADIVRRYGALDDATFAEVDLKAKYATIAFGNKFNLNPGEKVFVGVSSFRNREHHDEVMAKVDEDERIDELYRRITTVLDVRRVVRGEFKRLV
jgi:uncharacterized protein YbaA (DUF1428 family)